MTANATTLKTALSEHVEALNTARTKETMRQVETRLAKINELCEKLNDEIFNSRVNEILSKVNAREAMFRDWLSDRTVDVYSVKKSQKTGEFSLKVKENARYITFVNLESAYQTSNGEKHEDGTIDPDLSLTLARSKKYHQMLAYFVDNLGATSAEDLSAGVGKSGKVSAPKMVKGSAEERAELNFEGHSVNCLENQLNAIVAEILPFALTMKRADVNAIKKAYTKEKHLRFDGKKENPVLDNIIDAVQIRMANGAYKLNSKAACHKQAQPKKSERTEKQEEVMSKVGDRQHENQKPEQTTAA